MNLQKLIRNKILEVLTTHHFDDEIEGYRLLDLVVDKQMSQEEYAEIKRRLNFVIDLEFPEKSSGENVRVAVLLYTSPNNFVTKDPKGVEYEGNRFWLVVEDNKAYSFMNMVKRKRPGRCDFYLSYDYLRKLGKKELSLQDLNPANQEQKLGTRVLRYLTKLPKINIGSRNWYVDTDKEMAYPEGSESNFISFDKLLDLAKTPAEFNSLEPLIQERYERRKIRLNERH